MKKQVLLIIGVLFCLNINSQVPQGFNYQAIARDGTGNPLTDPLDVKIAILSDDEPETVIWEELHSAIDPDDQGLFIIVVGQGTYDSGPVSNFSDIDWTVIPKYIRTQIYYGGEWKNMGSTQLWSVPYAMVADSIGGPLKKLAVSGETVDLDEALFEVKNHTGQTVFAVYNEGVRIYVDDGAKGPKGGFAIGGFGTEKTPSMPLLVVDPDSIRMYIDKSGKTTKGGFAIGGYGADKADIQDFLFISDDSVRVYIDNEDDDYPPKGVKGGFAIGGYGTAKGPMQNLLTVSNDSVRIYLDKEGSDKGPKGGFAIGGYGATKGEMQNYLNVSPDSTRIYVNENGSKSGFDGFAVRGRNPLSEKTGDYMTLGKYNSKLYSVSEYDAKQEYTSWNLIVEESIKGSDTLKLLQAAHAILSMTIPYGADEVKGVVARFEINTVPQTAKGEAAKLLSVGIINVLLGNGSGSEVNGWDNVIIGNSYDVQPVYGIENVVIGLYDNYATDELNPSNNNVLIGSRTSIIGENNVCIGYNAGNARIEEDPSDQSNRLYIENSDADKTGALVYGEFDTDQLRLNAHVTVRDALKLEPRTEAPSEPTEGEIYYSSATHKLYVYDGTTWQECW